MNNSFEIFKTMVASTGHVEEQDLEALRVFPDKFCVQDYDYGMNIYLGDDPEDDILSEISNIRVSEGLKMLLLFAVSNGCLWLKVDADGPIYERFPTYDW
tara:strand:+ start:116 stop:415 length:300 start_codon:yes stop_codon:yes gene_type:complete